MADDVATAELTELPAEVDESKPEETSRGAAPVRLTLTIGLVIVAALIGLVGWVGLRAYRGHEAQEQRTLFLQAGRQGALNLTTVDFREADADVQRILAGATGQLYDNFSKRSQPFIDVVLRTKSKSVGTVTEAGIESQSGDRAEVLVAVTVHTSNAGAAEQEPHAWRMRLSVLKVGGVAKVSNVEFVR
ncbi:mammalian cell entry protein [Mycobacterium seoulense]|uniref:Mce associated membrane protein n=1 Tax=Mycobacterium seoulense TaxID=386911 RepID=A0A7I7NTD0_9MYCO|nr:mammalian cell entry protein [Mycobacterium seoulense]MCV7439863.1 mammalian cell entry protein [Mycobacterium seoulense]BBX99790.1 Mce associated membrane protein [Mycobacterium seoulense]